MSKPFVFNDQSQVNSYGFRILTSGINLKRFKKNPVMLNQHWNSTESVLGKWINIQVEKDLLLGEPVFDLEDEEALKVSGKVDREFINSCSMGITFNREDIKIIGTELIMEKCELYECSIVAVPSNANSIRLYAENGVLLKDEEVKQLCLSLQTENLDTQELVIKPETMKKIQLSLMTLVALGFTDAEKDGVEENVIETKILELSKKTKSLEEENKNLKAEKEVAEQKSISEMVDLALQEGRITADKKEQFIALAKNDLAMAKSMLSMLPVKQSLSKGVINSVTTEATTKEEFLKLSHQEQLDFKVNSPDEYKKLFTKNK